MLNPPPRHRCAVWGSPIEHSLSPVLHRAAYAALALTDWSYDRREVDVAGFPSAFAGLGPEWRGLSLTMPLKEVAATVARSVSDTARATGAVNTLVRAAGGWSAHNTDVHGIVAALAEVGCTRPGSAVVVGSGATARSAVRALEECGARSVTFMVRSSARGETVEQARRAGLHVDVVALGEWRTADVVVSTVPPGSLPLEGFPEPASSQAAVLDVVYGGGRTPLQESAARRGWAVADGTAMLLHRRLQPGHELDLPGRLVQESAAHRGWAVAEGTAMLLHQAARQVELMTGLEAPVEAMRAALDAARPSPAC